MAPVLACGVPPTPGRPWVMARPVSVFELQRRIRKKYVNR